MAREFVLAAAERTENPRLGRFGETSLHDVAGKFAPGSEGKWKQNENCASSAAVRKRSAEVLRRYGTSGFVSNGRARPSGPRSYAFRERRFRNVGALSALLPLGPSTE